MDALFYYPHRFIASSLFGPIFSATLATLSLQQVPPLTAALHFLRDLLAYGGDNPPQSALNSHPNYAEVKEALRKLALAQGEMLLQRVLVGMMFSFPRDCVSDASGVLMDLVQLAPESVGGWIAKTIRMLPPGTVHDSEADRLMTQINQCVKPNPFFPSPFPLLSTSCPFPWPYGLRGDPITKTKHD